MTALLESRTEQTGQDAADQFIALLLEEWEKHKELDLVAFWRALGPQLPSKDEDRLECLVELAKADLRNRIERGEAVKIENYLKDFPELEQGDHGTVSLIYEEFCLLEEKNGESPEAEAFYRRYEPWKHSLVRQFQLHEFFTPLNTGDAEEPGPRYPKVGDDFEEYQLLSLIGKGGSSRVFLAKDRSLGGKRVILKVSLDHGEEPKTQGVLDHPHIVPVNSVVFQLDEGLRGLSMPFRPGLPLDEIIRRVRPATRLGGAMALWTALFSGESPSVASLTPEQLEAFRAKGPAGDGWNGFPRSGTYAQGAAWVALILARTLQYAHEMRTFHRDVKPGNVLLTLQHGPQLLDFNLADSPFAVQHAKSAVLGGTLPYMAPEQIEAFLNPECWDRVGACSDIYSLGLLLRELLTGQPPDLPNDRLRLPVAMRHLLGRRRRLVADVRQFVPDIPFALEAIVKRCLCFRPADRYASAQDLAEDLERFLHREPLRVATNPSRGERLGNWFHRNQRKVAFHSAYLSLIGVLGFLLMPPASKPPLETHPTFLKALHLIDKKMYREALAPLHELAGDYPTHPLRRMYLGISQANSDRLVENDAQFAMGTILAQPADRAVLVDWARGHPALADHLSQYATVQLEHVNAYNLGRNAEGKTTVAEKEGAQSQDQAIEKRYVETNYHALQLALEANPDLASLQWQMAIAEENLGLFQSAHERVKKLHMRELDRGREPAIGTLVDLVNLQTRIALRWASALKETGNPADSARSMELLRQVRTDLEQLSGPISLLALPGTPNDQERRRVYLFYWYMTETWTAIGEAEQKQGRQPEADAAFKHAHAAFKTLAAYGQLHYPNQPRRLDSLRKRVMAGLGVKTAAR